MSTTSWNDLRLNRQLCDGVIQTSDNVTFHIHRVILSGFSPFFRAFFTNSLNRGQPEYSELLMPDMRSDIVGLIIDYAYTQHCAISQDNAHSLLVAADKLSCDPLVRFCSDFIAKSIKPSNCINNMRFAKIYSCRDLQEKAWQCLCGNVEQVMYSPEFQTLEAEELSELLSADELNVKVEETVFDAISRWVTHNPQQRQCHVSTLMHTVRFGLLSLEYYADVIKTFEFHTEESLDLIRTVDVLFDTTEDVYFYRHCYFRPRVPNEVIFTIGGWSEGSPTDVIEIYDKRSDSWNITDFRDQHVRAYHGAVVIGNMIYVVGGFDGQEYFNTMHCFDPVSYTWTEKACMHEVRCYISICVLEGEIYAMGGYNGRSRLSSAEKYNPATNQWTRIKPLNRMRSDASAAALNNKVYVAGGFNGTEVMRSVEVYDPKKGHWDYVDFMGTPRSGVSLIAHGRYIYALGGFDGISRLYTAERYSALYNKWHPIADMLNPRSNMASIVADNTIYVIGGFNGATTIPLTEFYDEDEDAWYDASAMNINRSALAACVCRGLPNAKNYTTPAANYHYRHGDGSYCD